MSTDNGYKRKNCLAKSGKDSSSKIVKTSSELIRTSSELISTNSELISTNSEFFDRTALSMTQTTTCRWIKRAITFKKFSLTRQITV